MANVYKRAGKDGRATWCIRYQDSSGNDIRQATKAKTKREAELLLANAIQEIADGTYELKKRQREVTFFEICDDFMVYSKAHKRSWDRDRGAVQHLKEFFGDCLAKEIRPEQIEDYVLSRKKGRTWMGRVPAPATINRELACLRTIFIRAVRNGKCERNPMLYVKFLKENNVRDRVLSVEEFERLLKVSPDHLKPILITAYETGMRSGEIFKLTWEQVDLDRGFITLFPEQTKTNEGRKIPVSPRLHQTLSQVHPRRGPVFPYRGKSVNSVKRSFIRACQQAGIENFRFHDFRHTFVTRMRRAGKQDRAIMAITGHKTFSVFTRYDTVDEEDLRRVVMDVEPQNPGTFLAHADKEGRVSVS